MPSESQKGHLAAITANVIFGLNMVVTKSLFSANWLSPYGYAMTRVGFGCIVFWIIGFFLPKEKVPPGDKLIIALSGILGYVICQTSFTIALRITTPVTMSLISGLSPIIVMLFAAFFLSEGLSLKKTLGVIMGISGAALVVLNTTGDDFSVSSALGIGIALFSVTCYSIQVIIMRKVSGRYSAVTMVKWMFLAAFLVFAPFTFYELPRQRLFSSEAQFLPIMQFLYTLILACLIAFILLPVSLKRIKATTASMYINLQPLVASVAAILIGQDIFSWDKPLALILIVGGVFIVTQSRGTRNESK